MDNQHEKIHGYRDLTQEEVNLMNEAKDLEAQVLAFAEKVHYRLMEAEANDPTGSESIRQMDAEARRWLNIGRTDVQKGFMALVRSVAQPQPVRLEEASNGQ